MYAPLETHICDDLAVVWVDAAGLLHKAHAHTGRQRHAGVVEEAGVVVDSRVGDADDLHAHMI